MRKSIYIEQFHGWLWADQLSRVFLGIQDHLMQHFDKKCTAIVHNEMMIGMYQGKFFFSRVEEQPVLFHSLIGKMFHICQIIVNTYYLISNHFNQKDVLYTIRKLYHVCFKLFPPYYSPICKFHNADQKGHINDVLVQWHKIVKQKQVCPSIYVEQFRGWLWTDQLSFPWHSSLFHAAHIE